MEENEISGIVLDAAIEVHRQLGGPGLLESVYEEALAYELKLRGVQVDRQVPIQILYKEKALATPLRVDLLVDGKVIVECKVTSQHNELFEAQSLTYLRITRLKLALIVNFGFQRIIDGYHRIANNL